MARQARKRHSFGVRRCDAESVTSHRQFPIHRGGPNASRSRPPSSARRVHHVALIYAHVDEVSLYFRDPDGARLELIADPLGEMYGSTVG